MDEATTIHDLLPEVLIKIFKKLEADSDLKNVKHTCYRWFELIDKRVGRKMAVSGRGLRFRSALEPLSQIGLQSCSITQYESDSDDDSDDEAENPEAKTEEQTTDQWQSALKGLKYPYLLKELYLNGPLPPDVFVILANPARNLSFFGISPLALSKVRNDDLKNLPFPQLTKLELYRSYQDYDFLPNLQTLLTKNRFPRLTHLSFRSSGASSTNFSMMGSLIIFIQDHHTLQELYLVMDMNSRQGSATPGPAVLYTNPELRAIISDIRKRGDCHLRKLDIYTHSSVPDPTHGFAFSAVVEILMEFLLNVVSLEGLRLELGPIPSSSLLGICSRNGTTLKELTISSSHSVIDCSVFASLKACQNIWITCYRHGAIGCNQLPPTLSSFTIWGPIGQADAEHVLFNLPKVQEVSLCYRLRLRPASRDGTCVTLDMLRRFNENRKVDQLIVRNDCFVDPESFPIEGIPNNDPENPLMLKVRAEKFCRVYWKLNEMGFYKNG